jgi:hypothetical protein
MNQINASQIAFDKLRPNGVFLEEEGASPFSVNDVVKYRILNRLP